MNIDTLNIIGFQKIFEERRRNVLRMVVDLLKRLQKSGVEVACYKMKNVFRLDGIMSENKVIQVKKRTCKLDPMYIFNAYQNWPTEFKMIIIIVFASSIFSFDVLALRLQKIDCLCHSAILSSRQKVIDVVALLIITCNMTRNQKY